MCACITPTRLRQIDLGEVAEKEEILHLRQCPTCKLGLARANPVRALGVETREQRTTAGPCLPDEVLRIAREGGLDDVPWPDRAHIVLCPHCADADIERCQTALPQPIGAGETG